MKNVAVTLTVKNSVVSAGYINPEEERFIEELLKPIKVQKQQSWCG